MLAINIPIVIAINLAFEKHLGLNGRNSVMVNAASEIQKQLLSEVPSHVIITSGVSESAVLCGLEGL